MNYKRNGDNLYVTINWPRNKMIATVKLKKLIIDIGKYW